MSLRRLTFAAAGVALGAALFKAYKMFHAKEALQYRIDAVKMNKPSNWLTVGSSGFDFDIIVTVINPTDTALPFKGMFLSIYVDGAYLGDIAIEDGKNLPPRSQTKLTLEYNVPTERVPSLLSDTLVKAVKGDKIDVVLKGFIQGSNTRIPVDSTYVLNEPLLNSKKLIVA